MSVQRLWGPRGRIACVLAGLLVVFAWVAAATGADAPGRAARVRMWHGLRIQSLDPPVGPAARAARSSSDLICPAPPPPKPPPPPTTTTTTTSTSTTSTTTSSTSTTTSTTSSTTSSTTTNSTSTTTTSSLAPAARIASRSSSGLIVRGDQLLSNERTFSRWAFVAHAQPVYAQPSVKSARVARLHWQTEDGFPEVYLLLSARCDAQRRVWVQVRVPMRPNGRTGWVPRQALGGLHLTRLMLVVNRARTRMYLYKSGRLRWSAPVGVGKPHTPTPAGHFWIRERFRVLDQASGYWPYAFGTADYSSLSDWPGGGVVGIHGPYFAPQSIPGHISHGCIRLHVPDDAWLARQVGVGTPLRVS